MFPIQILKRICMFLRRCSKYSPSEAGVLNSFMPSLISMDLQHSSVTKDTDIYIGKSGLLRAQATKLHKLRITQFP